MIEKQHWKKNIFLFIAGQTVSLFGSMLVQYAITWHITLETQSGVMMTLSIICGFVPTFLLSPFAGVWSDRYNRKLLIVLADGVIAMTTLVLAILFGMGFNSIWLLFVTMAIRSFGAGVQTPAFNAFIPQVVPEDKLTKINAITGSIQALTALAAPMISGMLLNFAKLENIFMIDVVTAVLGIATLMFFVRSKPQVKNGDEEKSYIAEMLSGIKYIKEHDFLKIMFLFFAMFSITVTPLAFLSSLHVTRLFGAEVKYLTALEVSFSMGMILGGIMMSTWGCFKNRTYTLAASFLITGAGTVILGFNPIAWVYFATMMALGITMPMSQTPFNVLIQEKVEDEYLGRVFSAVSMISSSMMPISMLVFGPLADAVPIECIMLATGVITLVLSILVFRNKTLIKAGEPLVKKEAANELI